MLCASPLGSLRVGEPRRPKRDTLIIAARPTSIGSSRVLAKNLVETSWVRFSA